MTKPQRAFVFVAVAVIAVSIGMFFQSLSREDPKPVAAPAAAFSTPLIGLDGSPTSLQQWAGKVLVVNFWATWCAPCRKEIPEFIRMQDKLGAQGVQFVGIAIDEKDKVRQFATEVGINYPILVGELDAVELGRTLGNELGALPYTVVFDRRGAVVKQELGATTESKLSAVLAPLL